MGTLLSLYRPLWTDNLLAKRRRAAYGGTVGQEDLPSVGHAEVIADTGDRAESAGDIAASDVLVGEFAEPVISPTAGAI